MSETTQRSSVANSTSAMSSNYRPSKKPRTSRQSSVKRSRASSEGDQVSQRLEEEESTKDTTTRKRRAAKAGRSPGSSRISITTNSRNPLRKDRK